MPWGALERPSLGLGLLQAGVAAGGLPCDTTYLGFALADRIGVDAYQWVCHTLPYEAFTGEWLFAEALYGRDLDRDAAFLLELTSHWGFPAADVARLAELRAHCTSFVEDLARHPRWGALDVVGFTSTFQQNLASLALARRIKERHPSTTIVFGGANWEGEMGLALHESFPFVDIVCRGEADESFLAVLEACRDGRPVAGIPGVVTRAGGITLEGDPARPVDDLDSLPVPDFEPFFRDLLDSQAAESVAPTLLVETARGCWWGHHSHCTFCGLNGSSLGYRSKRPERALAELDLLAALWGIRSFAVADNILDMRYFRSLLVDLAERDEPYDLFWEVKANLSRAQVRLLAAAGVRHVQPGIESLSDDVLALMRKGVSSLRNIALLKWCREYDLVPEWNVLFGAPGEDPSEYDAMAALFGRLVHLQPPSGHGQIRLDRFSPYHQNPVEFGITNVRPTTVYRLLYPFDGATVARISYYFDFDYADGREPRDYAAAMLAAMESWRTARAGAALWLLDAGDGARVLVDERGPVRRTARVAGWKAALLDACDRPLRRDELASVAGLDAVTDEEIDAFLARCVELGVMVTDGTSHLTIAVNRPARLDDVRRPRHLPLAVGS